MSKFIIEAEKIEFEAFKIRQNTPEWTYLKTQDKVKMFYKPSTHFNGNMYLFTTELDLPHNVVYEVMKPPKTTEERLKWDKSLKHYACVESVREDVQIGYLTTHSAALGVVSSREFVDLYFYKSFPEDTLKKEYGTVNWIFSKSIEHPSKPLCKEYVRGINFPGGYAVAENKKNPKQCFLELYVNCDVGGMLPRSVVEMALPTQQVSFIRSVEAEAKRRCA